MSETGSSNTTPTTGRAVTPDVTTSAVTTANATELLFTKDDVSSYIQIGIAAAIKKLEEDYERKLATLNSRLSSVEVENQELKERLDSVQINCKLVKHAEERLKKMEHLLEDANKTKKQQEKEINNLEQYSRRSHLRIRGLRMLPDETCKSAVTRFCKTWLHVKIQEDDLDDAHPLPTTTPSTEPKRITGPQPTPTIIVRFHCRHQRDAVLKARKALKGQSIVISEDLTKKNQDLLRRLHDSGKFASTWSWMGKVYAIARGENRSVRYDIHDTIP